MLKINLVSDVHLEFYKERKHRKILDKILATECDVLVIAGDLCTQKALCSATMHLAESGREIIYVVGNHEYYGQTPHRVIEATLLATTSQHQNFHWLHNNTIEIEGVKFLGTPMWHKFNDILDIQDALMMNDMGNIKDFATFVPKENAYADRLIRNSDVDVIVTHHMPSKKCVDPFYAGSPLNKFFLHPILEELKTPPKLWLYGHTHTRTNQTIGTTRVVCNPMGYPNRTENAYYKECILEI